MSDGSWEAPPGGFRFQSRPPSFPVSAFPIPVLCRGDGGQRDRLKTAGKLRGRAGGQQSGSERAVQTADPLHFPFGHPASDSTKHREPDTAKPLPPPPPPTLLPFFSQRKRPDDLLMVKPNDFLPELMRLDSKKVAGLLISHFLLEVAVPLAETPDLPRSPPSFVRALSSPQDPLLCPPPPDTPLLPWPSTLLSPRCL